MGGRDATGEGVAPDTAGEPGSWDVLQVCTRTFVFSYRT